MSPSVAPVRRSRSIARRNARSRAVVTTSSVSQPILSDWSVTDRLEGQADQDRRKVVSHGRSVAFQMAEVAIPRQMFHEILRLIAELRPQPSHQRWRKTFDGHAFKSNKLEECVPISGKIAR